MSLKLLIMALHTIKIIRMRITTLDTILKQNHTKVSLQTVDIDIILSQLVHQRTHSVLLLDDIMN